MNSQQRKKPTVSDKLRADIYFQLSRMEEAGFSALEGFELLKKTNPKATKAIQLLQYHLKAGRKIADSGYRAGIFTASDKDLLNAGESSGNLQIIYRQLASHYEQKVKRLKHIKSKSYLPFAILIVALFVQPLPALLANELSGFDYLGVSVGRLFEIIVLFYLLIKLPFLLTQGWLQFLGLKSMIYKLQLKLPLISGWLKNRQINAFFQSLGLMLTAGMPILQALPKAVETFKNPILKNQFKPIIQVTSNGQSLTDALGAVDEIDSQTVQILLVGEQSGKLAENLLHFTDIQAQTLEIQEQSLAEWLPRLFYFIVVCWVAISMINQGPIGSVPL
jgi:general secretion pathway protein F